MSDKPTSALALAALRFSMRAANRGLGIADAALRGMRVTVDKIAGRDQSKRENAPPAKTPADLEAGTSELANRLVRLARSGRTRPAAILRETFDAARQCFPRGEIKNPRAWLMAPLDLPLALGTLTMQELRRTAGAFSTVRPEVWPDFLEFVVEVFSDLQVYFTLRYGEELERRSDHLIKNPEDTQARFEYGRTLMKCGLFQEAVEELEQATEDPKLVQRALYESQVASYRLGDFDGAINFGVASLDQDPEDVKSRYWLWLAAQKAGGYPEAVPEESRMSVVAGYESTDLQLEDVATEIGLDKTSGGRGTAVFDSNGNGYLDVVIAGAHAGCSLYRNNGDGTFTDISPGSGLDKCVYAFSVAVGDYNNDGLPDLFISGLGFFDGQGVLMRNNGDGTFSDVTAAAGLEMWGPAFTATWVDYDLDGNLDLFIVNNLGGLFDRKTPNRLYHNNGDGTFTDVTKEAGLLTEWTSLGATWGDFRNNGLPDLFVSNLGNAQLFENNGDGTFTDVSRRAGVDSAAIGSASISLDIDNDGWLDIVQFAYSRPADVIHTLRTGRAPKGGGPLRVFRNNRDGTFTNIAPDIGLDQSWGTMSGAAGDISNNGSLDLLLGNGDPSMDRSEASILFEGDGKNFRNTTFSAGMPFTGKGHGANLADLAGDGRLHLIVGAGGLYPGDLMTTTVHRPKKVPGNYVNVRLIGTGKSTRDALGARIRLRAGGRDQFRIVSGGSGFGCMPFEQHFGLADLTEIERIEIRWPSGHQQLLETPPVNKTISITEGEGGFKSVY
ncbi:MAG: tetratricopeptide (TPR) repeat protein [Verrucomicrobiales bacterium]|jgi:tetratricopeptide (TPR) repeat protein